MSTYTTRTLAGAAKTIDIPLNGGEEIDIPLQIDTPRYII
jgi:hypothetical protein